MTDPGSLPQAWPRPGAPRPIVIVGAGAIVENAHLPAYRRLGLEVAGLFDLDAGRAGALAASCGARAFDTMAEAASWPGAIYDVAVPARAVAGVLAALPEQSHVLVQKPLGESLAEAKDILSLCRDRRLSVALNFQLRFSPNIIALKALLDGGHLGDVVDLEVRVVTHTPWEQWTFLRGIPRLELLYHSVHYLDAVRHLLGEPRGVFARATRNPALPDLADVASATILDYGPACRVLVGAFHAHAPLPAHAMSELRVEGTRGAAVARLGVNLAYPRGEPDTLEVWTRGGDRFEAVPLRGSWFTEAFEGPMSNLQRFAAGEDERLVNPVEDAVKTMALVEACYLASAAPGTAIPD